MDLKKALQQSCRFLVEECRRNQKKRGISAYNKIKHGLLIIPSAKAYIKTMPDAPAAIFSKAKDDPSKSEKPYDLYTFNMDDTAINNRKQSLYCVQTILRLFVALYLSATYPDHVQNRWHEGVRGMFMDPSFEELRHFLGEVTSKL